MSASQVIKASYPAIGLVWHVGTFRGAARAQEQHAFIKAEANGQRPGVQERLLKFLDDLLDLSRLVTCVGAALVVTEVQVAQDSIEAVSRHVVRKGPD